MFKNQNPARGRKPVFLDLFKANLYLFKNQNPARGRKLRVVVVEDIPEYLI